jgi:hypothetical protein
MIVIITFKCEEYPLGQQLKEIIENCHSNSTHFIFPTFNRELTQFENGEWERQCGESSTQERVFQPRAPLVVFLIILLTNATRVIASVSNYDA